MIEVQPSQKFEPGKSIGLFSLSEAVYRADPGINASALKDISRSVKFWEARKKQPREETEDMLVGSLFHLSLLEPHLFGRDKSHFVKPLFYPDAKTGEQKKWNGNATFCKDWIEAHSELPLIHSTVEERIEGMRAAVLADEIARDFIESANTEICIFVNDPLTGIRRKGKFDLLAQGDGGWYLGDLKKCQNADDEFAVARYVGNLMVHLQLAFYRDMLHDLFEELKEDQTPIFPMVGMIEDSIAPELVWWAMDADTLIEGRKAWRKAFARYAEAKRTGTIPGYERETKIRTLRLPAWLLRNRDDD